LSGNTAGQVKAGGANHAGAPLSLNAMDWKAQLANLSPEIVKLPITLFSGWLMNRLLTKGADLISYMSHVQTVVAGELLFCFGVTMLHCVEP